MFMVNFQRNLIIISFSFAFDFSIQKDIPNKAFEIEVFYQRICQNIICIE